MAKKPLKSLKDFFIKFVSVVDSGDNPEAEVVMFKNKGGVVMKKLKEIMAELSKEDQSVIQVELDKIPVLVTEKDDVTKERDGLVKDKEKLEDDVKKLEKVELKDETDEELIKSADPKIQKMLEKAKEVEDENAKLKKEKDEEVAKARKVELSKEAEEYPNLGTPVEDIVDILSAIDGDEKTTELVKGIFGAVNTALEGTKLLKSVGKSGDPEEKSPEEELLVKAEAMVEKDGITIEAAKSKVYQSNPSKYMK